jgi:hypothetical protein
MQAAEIPAAVEVVPTETPQAVVEAVPAPVVSETPAPAAEVPAEVPALSGGKRRGYHKKHHGSASLSKTGKKICPAGTKRAKHYSREQKKMVTITPIRCTRSRRAMPRHLRAIRFSGGEGEQQLEGGSRRRRRSRSRSRR